MLNTTRRLWKKIEDVKTYFVYSDEGLIGEYDENGVEIKGYGYHPNSLWTTNPLFQKTFGSYYWYHNDHLGTPKKLVDNQSNVVWEAIHEAFWKAQVNIALVENNLRFPGQYFDVETGLHYNYFRDYDPHIGRYIESDPIGLKGGLNTYVYVHSNPLNVTDQLGLWFGVDDIFTGPVDEIIVASMIIAAIANASNQGAKSKSKSSSTDWDDVQKQIDHDNYHRTCDRQPPPGLTPCEEAKWRYRQAQACYKKRQEWEERWGNKNTKDPHDAALAEVKNRMKNAAMDIKIYCGQNPEICEE